MRTLIDDENTGHLLPRDGAPNKSLLKSITAVNTMCAAAKLRSTIFVSGSEERSHYSDSDLVERYCAESDDSRTSILARLEARPGLLGCPWPAPAVTHGPAAGRQYPMPIAHMMHRSSARLLTVCRSCPLIRTSKSCSARAGPFGSVRSVARAVQCITSGTPLPSPPTNTRANKFGAMSGHAV